MHLGMMLLADIEPGGYINLYKLLGVLLLLGLWARLLTWIDKDAVAAHLPRESINTGLFLSGLAAFVLFFFLPGFGVAYLVLWLILLAGFGAYLGMRHQKVGLSDLGTEMAKMFKSKSEKKVVAKPGQVLLVPKSGNPLPAPAAEDPARVGYDAVQALLTDPLRVGAERVEARPGEGPYIVQFMVDGVAYSAPSMDRHAASSGITYLKQAAGLDVQDRRKPQKGLLRATMDGKRRDLEVLTAGTTAGESLRILVEPRKRWEKRLPDLGFQAEQLDAIKMSIAEGRGVALVCAPKAQGLTTMLYALLRSHDAFLTHIQTLERVPADDLEGVTQTALGPAPTPQDELKQVQWVISQQPDAIMLDEVTNPGSARDLARYGDEKRVYIGMRAPTTFEALALWRRLVGDDQLAMRSLDLVVCGRVLRRLCMACKVGYMPDPDTLRKLNFDANRVTKLFQARTQPMRDAKGNPVPCEFCHELRYKGRFGVYEVFRIDDEVRQAVLAGASVNQVKAIFRKQRGRYLQETALDMVEAGDTSVQEVLRVLRAASDQPAPAATQ